MIFKNTRFFVLFFATLAFGNYAYGQQEFTLYHMPSLAQSTYLNPAVVPEHKVSISLPVPSLFVGFNNSSINVKALMSPDGTVDYNKFVEGLKENKNYLGAGVSGELFHIRVKAADNFFSLSSRVIADARVHYPRDLFALASKGVTGNFSLSGLAIDATSYIEYAAGFTRVRPDSKWTYGARIKWLNGLANIQTKNTEIDVNVNGEDIYSYDITAKGLVNIGAALDGNKYKTLDDLSNLEINSFKDALNEFKPNNGIATDLGATFQFTEKLSFGASLLNLGFINWKNFVNNYQIDTHFVVEGVTAEVDFDTNLDSLFNAQVDSLVQAYGDQFKEGVDTTFNSYKTWLPTQLFLSANYQITPKFNATASVYTEFHKGVSVGTVVGANYRFGNTFDLTASWWWFNRSASNLGIGMVFKPWFGQIYIIMDNVLPGGLVKVSDPELEINNLWLPYGAKNFNLRAGINLVFGKIREANRLPMNGLTKKKDGKRKYLYKPPFKH
ncbi:MAG: hypothetical protein KDC79_00100 [Cyclobacteriaceae bacterium]|nr:hypothetical protein [Cyclobacteriaceae bacterium]